MTVRPRTLRESIAIAPDVSPAADPFGTESQESKEAEAVARRGILVRVTPEIWKLLKLTAIGRGTTVQALMLEAAAVVLNPPDDAPTPGRRTAL